MFPTRHTPALIALALLAMAPASALAQTAGNAAKGKLLFLQCGACHDIKANGPAKTGPTLFGIVGAKAGARPGFTYSPAFKAKTQGQSWDEAKLNAFIEKPGKVTPGTKMVFAGMPDPAKRADLIAYLKTLK